MISWWKRQPFGRLLSVVAVVALVVLTALAWLSVAENRESLRQLFAGQRQQVQADPTPQPPSAAKDSGPSEAERIARLHRLIEADEKQLAAARQRLSAPDSEYRRAEADFRDVDGRLAEKTREVDRLRKAGKKADADTLEKGLEPLKKQRQEARERFDLAIRERKTLQERVATLPAKIEQEKKALEKLEGGPVHAPAQEEPAQSQEPRAVSEKHREGTTAGKRDKAAETSAAASSASKPASGPGSEEKSEGGRSNKKLKEASERASKSEEAAHTARERLQSINAYLDRQRLQIAQEQVLLDAARQKAAAARRRKAELEQELKKRSEAGAPEAELAGLRTKIEDETHLIAKADEQEARSVAELANFQATLDLVQGRRTEAEKVADQLDKEANQAQKTVDQLQNPFTPHNVLQWFLDHGPRLLVILLGMLLLHRLIILSSRRIVRLMTRSKRYTERLDEEDRAETLVGVFRNTSSLLILGGGVLMLLDEVGIPIVPLMGGAAVFGLAVAFGAQNLIKDYFSGFMVLLEDQYAVNDVIRVGPIEGKVERISLRITVLRDVTGVVHFIPHGTITTVSNLTHGFSRAFFEIGVAYKEDADRVMSVLEDLARELRADPEFGPLILEDPEMLGVDAFGESSVVIKFYLDTKPLKQGIVKRELLRRIKRRFDQLGIEIPFPHRTVYHRYENGEPAVQQDGNEHNPYAA